MATKREIEDFVNNVRIEIDPNDIFFMMDMKQHKNVKDVTNKDEKQPEKMEYKEYIKALLEKNAEYIDIKKLLIINIIRLEDVIEKGKDLHEILKKKLQEDLEKTIKFSKKYIKPNEDIRCYANYNQDGVDWNGIYTSKDVIYKQRYGFENKRYDKIKDFIPNIHKERVKTMLTQILGEEDFALRTYMVMAESVLSKQGYEHSQIQDIIKEKKFEDMLKSIEEVIEESMFNEVIKEELSRMKEFINVDKYILFNLQIINEKLEEQKELKEDERKFLKNIEKLMENANKQERIKTDGKKSYGYEDVKKLMSKINLETWEYCTEEQLRKGEKLLQDTNGYENHLKESELIELAKIEDNLVYLARKGLINNKNVERFLSSRKITENTLIQLYVNKCMSLERLKEYSKNKNMDFEQLKEKIRQIKEIKLEDLDVKDKETWGLLNNKEKLHVLALQLKNGNQEIFKEIEKEELETLYDQEQIAQLYKEIYVEGKLENKNTYESLIKVHNILGNNDNPKIIELLEEEFSDDMLINLYSDKIISMNLLKEYAGLELVMSMFEEGKLEQNDKITILKSYPVELSKEDIIEMYQTGNIASREIIEFYLSDRIKLNILKDLNEILAEKDKINQNLSEKQLIELYQKAKQGRKEDNKLRYNKYKLLYQAMKRENLEESEKIELDSKIINSIKPLKKEDIEQLYIDNLLTLETILKYGGEKLVEKIALNNNLRPNDAKKFFEDREHTLKIEELLRNPNMSEEAKLELIYSTFADNREKREYLVRYLQVETITGIRGEESSIKKNRNINEENGESKDSIKTTTDPYERWRFLEILDKNYTKKYSNGYTIINLNNIQKTIIEQFYEKKHGKIQPAYGTATFVLDTEEYLKIEHNIITNEGFDITQLRKIAKENPDVITRITHHKASYDSEDNQKNSWGKRILKAIGNERFDEIYSDAELEEINSILDDIENSREEIK